MLVVTQKPLYHYLTLSYHSARQFFYVALHELKEISEDLEAFHKISQVALAILQSFNLYFGKNYLSKLMNVLDTANVDDFYEVLELLYNIFYFVTPVRIDERELLKVFQSHLLLSDLGKELSSSEVYELAYRTTKQVLESMQSNDVAYHDPKYLKKALIKQLLKDALIQGRRIQLVQQLNLNSLQIPIKPLSILYLFSKFSFSVAAIGCMPVFLDEWGVIPLAKVAESIGKHSKLISTLIQQLDRLTKAALFLGFLAKFIEACAILHSAKSTPNQIDRARYDMWMAAAETIFNLVLFMRAQAWFSLLLTIVTKSIGFWSVRYKPELVFFEE